MSIRDECSVVSLGELLDTYGMEETVSLLDTFRSVYNSDTESFLRKQAIIMELRDLSRTYLAISKSTKTVVGYVTIAIRCIKIPKDNLLSSKIRKNLNANSETDIVQSYLIGQLARSADAPKGIGSFLLDTAFEMLNKARGIVGCRVVHLDCIEKLIPYYTAQGFKPIYKVTAA